MARDSSNLAFTFSCRSVFSPLYSGRLFGKPPIVAQRPNLCEGVAFIWNGSYLEALPYIVFLI